MDAPGASDFRAIVLIVLGVLVALAFEGLVSRRRTAELREATDSASIDGEAAGHNASQDPE